MQNEFSEEPDESQGEHVEIYSKWAIRLFSLFMTPIFGGVLLIINLRKAGYKEGIGPVLAFSVLYTFIAPVILGTLGFTGRVTAIFVYFIGGFILSDSFYKKYFPDDDYYPKPVWGAVVVALLINVSFFCLAYYYGLLPPDMMKMLNKK